MKTPRKTLAAVAACTLLALATAPSQAANVLMSDLLSITATGTAGTLRPGSVWSGSAFPLSALSTVVDGNFLPDNQQWTNGTYWWDAFLNPQGLPNDVAIEITLNNPHTVNRFIVQGDNNESYLVEWWDGSAWHNAYTAPQMFTDGLETRDSGLVASVTASRFRVSASGGDGYYSLSEVQAFDVTGRVSEPGALALAAAGLVLALRRRPRQPA